MVNSHPDKLIHDPRPGKPSYDINGPAEKAENGKAILLDNVIKTLEAEEYANFVDSNGLIDVEEDYDSDVEEDYDSDVEDDWRQANPHSHYQLVPQQHRVGRAEGRRMEKERRRRARRAEFSRYLEFRENQEQEGLRLQQKWEMERIERIRKQKAQSAPTND